MMASEMIERVARAIEVARRIAFADMRPEEVARAAIEAMREPLPEMLAATVDASGTPRILDFTTPDERGQPFVMARYSWRAMITAALQPVEIKDETDDQ